MKGKASQGQETDTECSAQGPAMGSAISMEMSFISLLKPPALFPRSFEAVAEKVALNGCSACLVTEAPETNGPGR